MVDLLRQSDDLALWRFGIIASLLHRHDDSPPLYRELTVLAGRPYYTPDGQEKTLSADTLRLWLWRYKHMGLAGLRNKSRKDRGTSTVSDSLREALVCLRKEHPLYTVKRLLRELSQKEIWDGRKPSRTAMYRFTKAQGLNRNTQDVPESVRPFEYPHFGDLWSADFLHGPQVKEGLYARKAYLHAILDDATRYVVAATFHLAENTESLLSDLMLAVRRFGIPRRFYTDNGSAFRSHHLRLVAAKIRMALPHTPPYKPQGRGKIERFFRSLRDGFLAGRQRTSLQKLNADLAKWIDQYHQTIHSALDMSPLNRKLMGQGQPLEQIDPTQNINDLFRMETTKTVRSDGCVRLWGKRFEIPDAYPGETIQIYYLPWDQQSILCGPDKLTAKVLDSIHNARRFDQPIRGKRNNNPDSKENPL
jgi:putative transposase